MKEKKIVIFGFLLLIIMIVAGCGTVRLNSVFNQASVPTRDSVAGVNHTVGEILDIANATVKKAVYADYISVNTTDASNPELLKGSVLYSTLNSLKSSVVIYPPLISRQTCTQACSSLNLICGGKYSHTLAAGEYYWHFASPSSGCDVIPSASNRYPICKCLTP